MSKIGTGTFKVLFNTSRLRLCIFEVPFSILKIARCMLNIPFNTFEVRTGISEVLVSTFKLRIGTSKVPARTFEVDTCKIRNPGISKNIGDGKRILGPSSHLEKALKPVFFRSTSAFCFLRCHIINF
jgi:hypothetical protein